MTSRMRSAGGSCRFVTHATHTHFFEVREYAGVPLRRAGSPAPGATRPGTVAAVPDNPR